MTDQQVPRMPDLMTPAFDALAAGLTTERARVARNYHANHGRFGGILRGWRAQGEVARARFTREIIATRLIAANGGQPLQDLASSEYFADLADAPQYAIGELALTRTKTNTSSLSTGNFLAGVIPKGQKFSRPKSDGINPLSDADFLASDDLVCTQDDTASPVSQGGGNWTHYQTVVIPIVAASPGPNANTEWLDVVPSAPKGLFDSALPAADRFQPSYITSAGGMLGVSDAQLLDFAKAMATGRYGANNAAALAGARSDPRVRRVAYAMHYPTAVLWLYVADQSWASSQRYRDTVRQGMFDRNWVGFGGRISVGQIYNVRTTVRATVYLRSRKYAAEKTAITQAIRDALTSYFDDRRDFYTWALNAVGGVIASADARVLTCSAPVVLRDGAVLTEPVGSIAGGNILLPHYSLRGLELTFQDVGN